MKSLWWKSWQQIYEMKILLIHSFYFWKIAFEMQSLVCLDYVIEYFRQIELFQNLIAKMCIFILRLLSKIFLILILDLHSYHSSKLPTSPLLTSIFLINSFHSITRSSYAFFRYFRNHSHAHYCIKVIKCIILKHSVSRYLHPFIRRCSAVDWCLCFYAIKKHFIIWP